MALELIDTWAAQSAERSRDISPDQFQEMAAFLSDPANTNAVMDHRQDPRYITPHDRETLHADTLELFAAIAAHKGSDVPAYRMERIINLLEKLKHTDPKRHDRIQKALEHCGVLELNTNPLTTPLTYDQKREVSHIMRKQVLDSRLALRQELGELLSLEARVISSAGLAAICAWAVAAITLIQGINMGKISEMQRQEALRFPDVAGIQPHAKDAAPINIETKEND